MRPCTDDEYAELWCEPGYARVYWMVSWQQKLLYVGVSQDVAQRWLTHMASSPWSHFTAERHFGPEMTAAAAREQERAFIRKCRPRFNRMCNPDFEELGKAARAAEYQRRVDEMEHDFVWEFDSYLQRLGFTAA